MSYGPSNVTVDLTNSKILWSQHLTNYMYYATVAQTSNALSESPQYKVGQQNLGGTFLRYRWFMNFDLPAHYMAMDAVLHYNVQSLYADTAFVFEVRTSTAAVPPILTDYSEYGAVLDSLASGSLSLGWHTFDIPSANLAAVTKLAFASDREIANTEPTDKEYVYIYANTNSVYLTIQVPLASQAPTNLQVTPFSDATHIKFDATYNAGGTNGNTDCTYRRIQISDDAGFTNILKDTTQEAVSPGIADGDVLSEIIDWFPSAAGTYYIRMATWDDDNKDLAEVWGSTSFVVAYPTETYLTYTQNKEKFTFTAAIEDAYSKPPRVTLTVGNKSYVMDIESRKTYYYVTVNGDQVVCSGDKVVVSAGGNYVYTYTKTIELEEGDLEYHIEIGNVWTVKIGDTYFLHANYKLDDEKAEIFWNDKKINAWNITLEENLLPDLNKVEFDTDENITTGDLKLVTRIRTLKSYLLQTEDRSYNKDHYHIKTIETAKRDLDQTVSASTKSANSKTFLESILPDYTFLGSLDENIVLQQFTDEKVSYIFDKVLVLNGAYAFLRNNQIKLHNPSDTAKLTLFKTDKDVKWTDSRRLILNHLREYYKVVQYPVPSSLFTDYDSSNWVGTVSDVIETEDAVVGINPYILKGDGTISRTVDFLLSDFDQFKMNWCPDSATSIPIRLETDAANYYTCTRHFSGKRGAGFTLTGSSATDEITKTINFSTKYISKIEGYMTAPCKVKYTLKLSGVVVSETDYQNVSDYFGHGFSDVECDEIILTFSNLYIVSNNYGVSCTQLKIEEYKQHFVVTGTGEIVTWTQHFTGVATSSLGGHPIPPGGSIKITASVILGSVPALFAEERYKFEGDAFATLVTQYNDGEPPVITQIPAGMTFSIEGGKLKISLSASAINPGTPSILEMILKSQISYSISAKKIKITTTGEYVWYHTSYAWSETYNLWDYVNIPLSNFSKVGNPTNQINTIRLLPTGDNYYENIYVYASNPTPQFIEVKNWDSIKSYGDKFQVRKTDGWSSKESATAFANALIDLLKDPIMTYQKTLPINTRIECGDMVKADGVNLPIKRISYDFEKRLKTIFVGKAIENTKEFLKSVSKRIETLEKNVI